MYLNSGYYGATTVVGVARLAMKLALRELKDQPVMGPKNVVELVDEYERLDSTTFAFRLYLGYKGS